MKIMIKKKKCIRFKISPSVLSLHALGSHFGQLLDLVGIEVEFEQGLLEAEDLLGDSLQAAVGVVQRCHCLLLAPQAAAWHQANKQAPLGHPQALHRDIRWGRGYDSWERGACECGSVCRFKTWTSKDRQTDRQTISVTLNHAHVLPPSSSHLP